MNDLDTVFTRFRDDQPVDMDGAALLAEDIADEVKSMVDPCL